MKIKKGFELRSICGENIIISLGKENINFTKVITLNETAACVWNAVIGTDFTVADGVKAITAEYEIDDATATADVEKLYQSWVDAGLAE